jgi:hypothetical protein
VGASIDTNGGTLRDAAGNDANATLNSVGSTTGVLVDAVAPSVTSINRVGTALTNAASVDYTVTLSENVSGLDTSDFTLTATGTASGSIASVSSVSGSVYTVTVNSLSGDGTLRLDLNNAGTGITDTPGNAIASGFTAGQTYTLDHTAPAVTSVSVPANATYIAGQNLDFTVNLNEAVTVDTGGGTPRIALTLDTGGTVYASYLSGSGTAALTFRYTVASGNADANGIAVGASIDTNGGTLRDAAGNDANATLNSVGSTAAVLVDGILPRISSIDAVRGTGALVDTVTFTVQFSEAVSGVDAGDFTLTAGAGISGTLGAVTPLAPDRYAVAVTGVQGSGTLTLALNNGGTGITDGAGNSIAAGQLIGQYSASAPVVAMFSEDRILTHHAAPIVPWQPEPLILLDSGAPAGINPLAPLARLTDRFASPAPFPELNRVLVDGDGPLAFVLPLDARSQVGGGSVQQARLVDGAPLPSWMRFDPVRGVLEGQPPAGFTGLVVEIISVDAHGNRSSQYVEFRVQGTGDESTATTPAAPAGKPALQSQFDQYTGGKHNATADRLWQQLRLAAQQKRAAAAVPADPG